LWRELQDLMWNDVGLLRTGDKLARALDRIQAMRRDDLAALQPPGDAAFNMELLDWYDLRAGLLVAETIAMAAINRRESRGAHQREDLPDQDPAYQKNQTVTLDGETPVLGWIDVVRAPRELSPVEAAQ
jgi:succinate dehydrogenase/fumarate reductase flavoprotein subunit